MGTFQDDTLWRQAKQAFQAGQLAQAQANCEKLLRRNSKNVNALEMLGRVALAQGFTEKATGYITTYATLRPRDPVPQLLLGEILTIEGKHREAVKRFDRALRLHPDSTMAVAGKAGAYEMSGQRDKARAVLEPFVSTGRDTGEMAIIQARLDLSAKDDDAAIALAQRHLAAESVEGTVQWHLCYLLGRALERCGRFDEAFAAYERANATMPAPFDADGWREATDRLIDAFTPERFAQLPRATNGSQLPVFIVGMPRSGSTLIETIIDAHPEAHGAGEFEATHFLIESIPLEIGSNLPYPACIEDFDQSDVDGLSRTYLDQLAALDPQARRITDKYLINYRHLGLLAVLFPAARIIHCRRHPLDICLSCYAMALMPHTHPFASDLRHLATVYLDYERVIRHYRDVLEIPMLEVPYEGLVADQEPWSRRIIEFCGLGWDDRCLRFHEGGRVVQTASYDQVTKPVYTSSVCRYRAFETHLGPLKEALTEGGWTEEALPRGLGPA